MRYAISLGLLAAATAYAVANYGAIEPVAWNVALAMLGFAGAASWTSECPLNPCGLLGRLIVLAALLFPIYVTLQVVPLPLSLIRVLDPTRAEIADALNGVMAAGNWSPLSIVPGASWV